MEKGKGERERQQERGRGRGNVSEAHVMEEMKESHERKRERARGENEKERSQEALPQQQTSTLIHKRRVDRETLTSAASYPRVSHSYWSWYWIRFQNSKNRTAGKRWRKRRT